MLRYLRARRRPAPGPRSGPAPLGSYPVDLRPWATAIDRLPVSLWFQRTPGRMPLRKGPVAVAEAAIGYSQLGATADLRVMADWLVVRGAPGPGGHGRVWYLAAPEPRYGLEWGGWPSARVQGQAMSALVRAHLATGDAPYLEIASDAVEALTVDVADGGLARRVDGRVVLEACPAPEAVGGLVGWLYALVGLRELGVVTGEARPLLHESAGALADLLPRYEGGRWSNASLQRDDLASVAEHRLAARLLDALADLEPRFGVAAARMRAQDTAARWPLAVRARRG